MGETTTSSCRSLLCEAMGGASIGDVGTVAVDSGAEAAADGSGGAHADCGAGLAVRARTGGASIGNLEGRPLRGEIPWGPGSNNKAKGPGLHISLDDGMKMLILVFLNAPQFTKCNCEQMRIKNKIEARNF
jgi:hypothetical protein